MNYKWPLNNNNFTLRDKLKICSFFLNNKLRWTQDTRVKEFETKIADFTNNRHAVFVSSGSTANTILAMYLKDKTMSTRKTVVFPSNTWITSVSPFIREGFTPKFLDISERNLSLNLNHLEQYLDFNHTKVAAVFITTLLGISINVRKLWAIRSKFPEIHFWLDNCESTFTQTINERNISGSGFTSTTSTYFGHQLQSVEGGFVLTDSDELYEYAVLARNHGLTRSLSNRIYRSDDPSVDERFDFCMLGNNFRNTDINAFIGLLNFEKIPQNIKARQHLYQTFCNNVDLEKYLTFGQTQTMFCLPIITRSKNPWAIERAKIYCIENGIETRPVIAGNLLRQTCLKKYDTPENFPVSEHVHHFGFYVGLHEGVKEKELIKLAKSI